MYYSIEPKTFVYNLFSFFLLYRDSGLSYSIHQYVTFCTYPLFNSLFPGFFSSFPHRHTPFFVYYSLFIFLLCLLFSLYLPSLFIILSLSSFFVYFSLLISLLCLFKSFFNFLLCLFKSFFNFLLCLFKSFFNFLLC